MAMIRCPECGKQISDKAKKCPQCGCSLGDIVKCPECGEVIADDKKTCPKCGYPLAEITKPESSTPSAPSKEDITASDVHTLMPMPVPANATEKEEAENTAAALEATAAYSAQDLCDEILSDPQQLNRLIGKNGAYYAKQFTEIKEGRKASFNWAIFFFNPLVALYRKNMPFFKKYYLIWIVVSLLAAIGYAASFCAMFLGAFAENDGIVTGGASVFAIIGVGYFVYTIVLMVLSGKNFNKSYKAYLENQIRLNYTTADRDPQAFFSNHTALLKKTVCGLRYPLIMLSIPLILCLLAVGGLMIMEHLSSSSNDSSFGTSSSGGGSNSSQYSEPSSLTNNSPSASTSGVEATILGGTWADAYSPNPEEYIPTITINPDSMTFGFNANLLVAMYEFTGSMVCDVFDGVYYAECYIDNPIYGYECDSFSVLFLTYDMDSGYAMVEFYDDNWNPVYRVGETEFGNEFIRW